MTTPTQLFLLAEEPESTPEIASSLKPMFGSIKRVLMPNRTQLELPAIDLDSLLPEGHRARVVWAYVMQADLGPIYAGIKAAAVAPRLPRNSCSRCGCTPRSRGLAVPARSPV